MEDFSNAACDGLSTQQALEQLYQDVLECNKSLSKWNFRDNCRRILHGLFHHKNEYITFNWMSYIILISGLLFAAQFKKWDEALYVGLLITCSCFFTYWQNHLRYNEFNNRLSYILKQIRDLTCYLEKHGSDGEIISHRALPNLYSPSSPAISLQWTSRMGKLVNLPSILLSAGDIIILRPGQQSPADVVCLKVEEKDVEIFLKRREIFDYEKITTGTILNEAELDRNVLESSGRRRRLVQPLKSRKCRVMEAPFLQNLKIMKEAYLKRPPSIYEKAKHLLFNGYILVSLLFVLGLWQIVACLRYYWLELPFFHDWWWAAFGEECLCLVICVVPFPFGIFWFWCNVCGNALLHSTLQWTVVRMRNNAALILKS